MKEFLIYLMVVVAVSLNIIMFGWLLPFLISVAYTEANLVGAFLFVLLVPIDVFFVLAVRKQLKKLKESPFV